MTSAQFRADFPEFSSTAVFPDSGVNYWLNIATLMLNASRWGNLLDLGTELFIAHNIVLEAQAQQTSTVGGLPGLNRGAISAESVDKVSLSYDTNATLELEAGHWNLTVFGTRFIHLSRMMGAGPIQVGAGCGLGVAGAVSGSGAWPGPLF